MDIISELRVSSPMNHFLLSKAPSPKNQPSARANSTGEDNNHSYAVCLRLLEKTMDFAFWVTKEN